MTGEVIVNEPNQPDPEVPIMSKDGRLLGYLQPHPAMTDEFRPPAVSGAGVEEPDPIWILCEGSGGGAQSSHCPICARTDIVFGGLVTAHNRPAVDGHSKFWEVGRGR